MVLGACLLHREVLFGGAVYHMDDAADGYYPGHIAVARAFAKGELPTWEGGSWCGWPLVVDPYNGVFYPLNVVYLVAGAARGLGYSVALHVLLGGIGMWWLLRRRNLSYFAALAGGLAYELSSFGVVRIRHVIFVQTLAWLPWILVGVEGWLTTRKRRELALVSGATGLALVAGALSIGHFAVLAIAAYTAARAITRDVRRSLADLAALAGAAIVGALVAAAQIAPTLAHLPNSPRQLGSDYQFASSYAWPTLHYLQTLVAPDLMGGEERSSYFGAPNHWELCGWYVGAPMVLAAIFSLLPRPQAPAGRRGPERYVLLGMVLLAIGLAFGDAGPVHPFFYKHLPLYAALRCPTRALLIAVLALPILGADGLDALVDLRAAVPRSRRALAVAAIVTGLLVVLAALVVLTLRARLGHPGGAVAAAELSARMHLALVCSCAVLALALTIGRLVPRSLGTLAFALVLLADLLAVDRGYVTRYHRPADYPAGMERFAAVEWMLAHTDGADRFVNDPRGPFRLNNVGMVIDRPGASGYDSFPIWRYVELLYLLKNGARYPHQQLKDDFAAIGVWNLSSRLLDLMNVRWLLAGAPPDARWVERFRPPPNAPTGAPAAQYEPWWDANMRVYENTHVLPRAFIAHRVEIPGSDDKLAARLVSPGFDPGATALLEEAPGIEIAGAAPFTAAKIVATTRHSLTIDTDDRAPGLLIVSDVHYPGWSVTVDGQPVKLLRADWAFRGVALPAGHHRVEMRYRSRAVEAGLALSALGLVLMAWLAFPLRGLGARARAML